MSIQESYDAIMRSTIFRLDGPEIDLPGMQVTVGADDRKPGERWSYGWQTGDSSLFGGAYPYRHWGVGYLYPDTDTKELAEEMADEILEGIAQQ